MTAPQRRNVLTLIVLLAAAVPRAASAQQHHNSFGGTWVLDSAHSDASSLTPQSATYTVIQSHDTLNIDRVRYTAQTDTIKSHFTWAIDGKPWVNTLQLASTPVTATAVAAWAGDTMVVTISGTVQGQDLLQTERWLESADGSTLIIQQRATYGGHAIGSPLLTFRRKRTP